MSLLPGSKKSRHARPSKVAPVLAAGGVTATVAAGAAVAMSGSADAASSSDFARLRACESGGNYGINTGNGFYGAYQFDLGTWHGLGYSGRPDQASAGTQDAAAAQLQAQRGWSPWPGCSRKLGLGSGVSHSSAAVASRSQSRTAVTHRAVTVVPLVRPTAAPAFAGHVLSISLSQQNRADVRRWQHRMAARGWHVAVDGHFGPQSAAVATRFAAEKNLHVSGPGRVDQNVWRAAWESPLV